MITRIYFLILLIVYTKSEDVFENSTNLCTERCSCTSSMDNLTLYINCSNRNMKHTIANWPQHSENLIATFGHNEIITLQQMPGSGATNIRLSFSNCKIRYLQSGLFENTINVKLVDLSHNLLESEQLSADVFKGSYNNSVFEPIALEHLDLSYNQIHSLQKKIFIHTPNLEYLNLEGNSLRVIDHVTCLALSTVTNMKILNLARNRLTELPIDAIKHYPNLTTINLSNNEFDFVPESLTYVATSLQVLNVSHNPIVQIDHTSFEGLQNILKLYANNLNRLRYVHAKSFSWLKSLQVLDLSHNENLIEIDEYNFGSLDKLAEVYINDNGLLSVSPNLLPWSQLQILDMTNNDFVCNCELFNVSKQIPTVVKRHENYGPKCVDPRTLVSVDMYSLTNQTCSRRALKWLRKKYPVVGHPKIMKVTLTTLILVLIVTSTLAIWIGYSKWSMYRRNAHYPFPDQVLYRPVHNIFP